jgi:hypothetical protein
MNFTYYDYNSTYYTLSYYDIIINFTFETDIELIRICNIIFYLLYHDLHYPTQNISTYNIYVYIHTRAHTQHTRATHISAHICMYVCMRVCMYACMMYACMYVCVNVCMRACVYAYIYVCVICVCVYTYM